jgi:hypothetical protein
MNLAEYFNYVFDDVIRYSDHNGLSFGEVSLQIRDASCVLTPMTG